MPLVYDILQRAEMCMRQGQSKVALRLVYQLLSDNKNLRVEKLIKIGNILGRAGDNAGALKLLHPFVRDQTLNVAIKSPAQVEYAAALIQLGLVAEGNEMLSHLNEDLYPEAQMHRVLGLFQEWNYLDAIPLLERWIKHPRINDYQRLVGQINLFIAYAFARPDKLSATDIDVLGATIHEQNYSLLMGAWSQIKGRFFLEHGDYNGATTAFTEGLNRVMDVNTWDRLYLSKWNLVCQVKKDGPLEKWKEAFNVLRLHAHQKGDFETVRDCDYHLATHFGNREIGNYCYHGTPFKSFRDRFDTRLFSSSLNFYITPGGFQRRLNFESRLRRQTPVSLNELSSVFNVENDKKLTFNGVLEKTLMALMSDFYRPMTLQRLFGEIYKGQYWNQNTSPTQIRQVLFRFRKWLKKNNWDLKVEEKKGTYRLASGSSIYKILQKGSRPSIEQRICKYLYDKFKKKDFLFSDFEKVVNSASGRTIAPRTLRRWIKNLQDQGWIKKSGHTRAVVFKLVMAQRKN